MPKPSAGWTLYPLQAVPKPSVSPKVPAPDRSWWLGLSRQEFQTQLGAEVGRMNSSKLAAYLHPSFRVIE